MSSDNRQHSEEICVGTIISEQHHQQNHQNEQQHQHIQNDAYAWQNNNNQFSQTLPFGNHHQNLNNIVDNRTGQQQQQQATFQQPQHQQQQYFHQHSSSNNNQHQQQNVIYATNPQTGQTVMFPVIPAMFAPPNHSRGSPTYEYHQTLASTNTFLPRQHNHSNSNNNLNNTSSSSSSAQQQSVVTQNAPENSKIWSTGLFECFDDSEGLVESWCCNRCQLSRQYGFIQNGVKDIDLFSFFFSVVIDALAAPTGIVAFTWYTRRAIRQRYGIIGSDCSDCFVSFCCGPCATHQQYRQMSIEGDWPTGCCINNVYSLPASIRGRNRVQEMGTVVTTSTTHHHNNNSSVHQGELIMNNNQQQQQYGETSMI